MNFSYGIIITVGILAAISIAFIAMAPTSMVSSPADSLKGSTILDEPPGSMVGDSVCGVDGKTYENQLVLESAGVQLDHFGQCVISESISESEPESLPMSTTVSIPAGSAIPGCEETDECYIPFEINVAVGATISWSNDDTAAHTVTSGIPTEGPDGIFDSSLFMSAGIFEFTFNDAGTFDYFCLVHPWMLGTVNVVP